jgi:DNA-binding CsgD family transcriptional regulator
MMRGVWQLRQHCARQRRTPATLTSRQIAAALMISVRTVESHIENIMTRRGFGSRSQIAAWYIGQSV